MILNFIGQRVIANCCCDFGHVDPQITPGTFKHGGTYSGDPTKPEEIHEQFVKQYEETKGMIESQIKYTLFVCAAAIPIFLLLASMQASTAVITMWVIFP